MEIKALRVKVDEAEHGSSLNALSITHSCYMKVSEHFRAERPLMRAAEE